ncbi:MAG TPA: hypothetical protein DCK93_12660 [Blastocatellia bacterium]|jgi:nitrate reductase delta subunit|nr:hypothetical protein [Blastocatellia bacterium]HAF23736.1 hypothetical protein [Blastocatellia bacterium]
MHSTKHVAQPRSNHSRSYNALANLLDYPGADWSRQIELMSAELTEEANAFAQFRAGIANLSLAELQELYTRTFDLSPVCALEIGYHLFGENYKRGIFLANLRETEAPFDLGQEHQLPDYLPVLLRLLTKLADEELRESLIGECLLPALAKMLVAFGDGENPYRHLVEVVRATLRAEVSVDSDEFAERAFCKRASLPVFQPAEQA